MGQGGYLTLVNGSPYTWTKTYQHAYQMDAWSWPTTISPGTAQSVYVEWHEAIFSNTKDDAGEVTYSISSPSGDSFQIQARATNGFNLQTWLNDLTTSNNGAGSTLSLGWDHDGYVNFILSGTEGKYSSSNPPTAWMANNLAKIGSRTLRHIVIPGSHDAGMSLINDVGGTAGAFDCNTVTQKASILQQLKYGARYFDIRPVISSGQFYTGHYSFLEDVTWQGANGQSIAEVVNDVNTFTASNPELIILNLSHDYDTDRDNDDYQEFTQAQWNSLLSQLKSTLKNLYIASSPTTVDLTTLTLNTFIGGGKAAVVVIVEPANVDLGSYHSAGFYAYTQLNAYNDYADTNNVNTMINDQIALMKKIRTSPDSQYFLLSWTLTQDAGQAIGCVLGVEPSIVELGEGANYSLYSKLLSQVSKSSFPNILYIDSIGSSDVTALAMALNDYVGS